MGNPTDALGKVSILIVDDRADKLLSLEAILSDLGENLVKATSGRDALRALLNQDFAVILLDVNMPIMDGFETAALIRQRKNSEKTPIIFVTAFSDTETHVSRGYSLGAVDYMRTPVEPEILKAKVTVFVDLFKKTEQVKRQAEDLRVLQEKELTRQIEDATDRLEAETKRNRFFTLAVDMLCISGFDDYFRQMNPTWEQTVGFTEHELRERPLTEFVHPADREATVAELERLKHGAARSYFENRFLCKDGSYRWLGWTAAPFVAEGLLYMFARDITDLRRAEEERVQLVVEQSARASAEASQRRAAFLADVAGALAESLDYRTTLARVARLAVPLLADWCFLDIVEEDGTTRVEAVHADPAQAPLAERVKRLGPQTPGAMPQAEVMRTGKPLLVAEVDPEQLAATAPDSEHAAAIRECNPRSMIVVPLTVLGSPLGTLTFVSAASGRRYGPDELGLAEELARRASLAIENARLYKQSQDAREAAETANRAKDEFLATLSHELRTPLSPILGWTLMLRAGSLDEAASARALEVIERNVRAQTQLIEDLLDVSRIITGKLRLDVRAVDLAPVISAGIDAVRPSADAKGIVVDSEVAPVSGVVAGDPDRLQQILWNLLANAVKFTPREGRISVRLRQENAHAVLEVKDTGRGIAPRFLPYVFDRFRQADSSSTRVHGGLGLGLAIVRHLAELHGGTVHAYSEGEGKGATFTVSLPLREPDSLEDPALAQKEEEPGEAAVLQGVRVLIADDEQDTREFLALSLERFGASVESCGSAAEVLAQLDRVLPDVLVSDIGMPEEDGYALIRKIRARPADRGGQVPAAALTAYAMGEDGVRALSAGFQVHLAKPVEPALLARTVATLAGRHA